MDQKCRGEILAMESQGLLRRLLSLGRYEGGWVETGGQRIMVLGANDYLGLSAHPEVKAASAEMIQFYGCGATGSRLLSGDRDVHRDLERTVAGLKAAEDALLFPSGYMANVGTIPALVGTGDLILSDECNHASIIDGCRLSKAVTRVYRHLDVEHIENILEAERGRYRHCLIVTDGVFSMEGDIAPLGVICDLAERYGAWVMVDDAHGTGVLGRLGAGSADYCGVYGRVAVQMGTFSKALGTQGGFVAGSSFLVEYLRNRARSFMFSTALAPAVAGAALAAINVAAREDDLRQRVLGNADCLRRGLAELGFAVGSGVTPVIPIFVGDSITATRLAECLLSHGVYAPAIRPPAVPHNTARLRVTACATHTQGDLDRALEVFAAAGRELGVI